MSSFNNGARVDDARAPEKTWEIAPAGRFVDGCEQLSKFDANVVRSRNDLDARTEPPLLVVEILNRRKFQLTITTLLRGPRKSKHDEITPA